MRVLVTGAGGQVGHAVALALEGRVEVIAHDHGSLDLCDPAAIALRVREARPDAIVNAAAYTAVDRAESDRDAAFTVNAVAPGLLAAEAKRAGAVLLHFSTDYVFDGAKASPYVEDDATGPLNFYGRSKLDGERAIEAAGADHLILRTSWVYGPRGANFLLTMLRLGATRDELRIVDDQRGAPTSSLQLAALVRSLVVDAGLDRLRAARGTYHATAAGATTWFGFARAIFASREGLGRVPRLVPIASSEYPTPAKRPANSVLSCEKLAQRLGLRIPPWERGLADVLSALG